MGKALIICGIALIAIGAAVTLGPKVPWLGRLPGDIYIQKKNVSFYFPLATSVLISVVLSVLVYLFRKR